VLAAYLSALCEHQRNIAAHNTLKAEADKVGRRYLRASRELRETHDILQGIGQALPPMTREEDPIIRSTVAFDVPNSDCPRIYRAALIRPCSNISPKTI
jgi:hypothetical protein